MAYYFIFRHLKIFQILLKIIFKFKMATPEKIVVYSKCGLQNKWFYLCLSSKLNFHPWYGYQSKQKTILNKVRKFYENIKAFHLKKAFIINKHKHKHSLFL